MASIKIDTLEWSYVTFKVSGLTKGDDVCFWLFKDGEADDPIAWEDYETADSSTLYKTYTGLRPKTKYAYNYRVDGKQSPGSARYFTTPSDRPNEAIEIYELTASYVTFKVSGLVSGDIVKFFVIEQDENKTPIEYEDHEYRAAGSTLYQTFKGLKPETRYAYNFKINNITRLSRAKYFNTPSNRPSNWSWWSTVSFGSSISISASEWNAFCKRINAFRDYKGVSSYSFITVSSGTKISAAIVNQARTAINGISGHGTLPSAATTGGTITASFFNKLASALNSVS